MGDDDPDRIDEDNVQCDCLFFRKYYLPCRHIFLADRTYEILTEDHWNDFVVMFANRGFDVAAPVCNSHGHEPSREGDRGDIGAPTRRALTLKKTLERLRSRYYELEEDSDPDQRENLMNLWLGSLQRASADFLTEEGTTCIINAERERRETGGEE
ncbi:hypothetical protein POJ06DRAFT_292611 [Lipomyces tetrasporus]|uniref:SWIM-type domain-containing protein n=1 Tax=Lipomyces tetrasporus TaxID=54092 RepID=A0AAD7VR82_9ASCO|nr:uncharacterized protein POJ06DRAFT_292611 [Lipomyces tetrasporus]KAJ8098933.1 hypothetical protein POJ06DRAFT_292611 [Lipomyces tetrasporus]